MGSSEGTGKAYFCVAHLHRGVVGKVNSVWYEVGRGNRLYNNWSVIVQSTGEGLRGSKRVIRLRGLSGVRETLEDLLEICSGERGSEGVLVR